VLAWLMGGAGAEAIRQALAEAQAVVASDLTLVECDRVLARTVVEGRLREAEAAGRQALLARLGHSRGRKRGLPQAGTFSMIEPGPGGSILDERQHPPHGFQRRDRLIVYTIGRSEAAFIGGTRRARQPDHQKPGRIG